MPIKNVNSFTLARVLGRSHRSVRYKIAMANLSVGLSSHQGLKDYTTVSGKQKTMYVIHQRTLEVIINEYVGERKVNLLNSLMSTAK